MTEETIVKSAVADPGVGPDWYMANEGATLHWFNESDYPEFHVRFAAGNSPVQEGENIVGTKEKPAVMHVSGPEGTYFYTVHYTGHKTKQCSWSGVKSFIVGHCNICGP